MEHTNNQPLLTVIVPCYNVEKYVDKCISSIVNQTYSNLEILLIDDGSTDSTGKKCDEWKNRDLRIRVIHKQNEGLPYARKTGVENTTADYIAFVDSDDWIDTNMYSDMMSALLTTNSDIAQCDYCTVYEDGRVKHRVNERQSDLQVMNRMEAMKKIILKPYWTAFWINIFKKHLFDGIVFKKELAYGEDLIIHYMFHRSSQTVYLDREYYFYLIRNDSISNHGAIQDDMKRFCEITDAWYDRYIFLKPHPEYNNIIKFVKHKTICLCMGLMRNMIVYPKCFPKEHFKYTVKQLSSISITQDDKLHKLIKFEIRIIMFNPKLYKILRTLYVFVIRITNKLKITNRKTSVRMMNVLLYW